MTWSRYLFSGASSNITLVQDFNISSKKLFYIKFIESFFFQMLLLVLTVFIPKVYSMNKLTLYYQHKEVWIGKHAFTNFYQFLFMLLLKRRSIPIQNVHVYFWQFCTSFWNIQHCTQPDFIPSINMSQTYSNLHF